MSSPDTIRRKDIKEPDKFQQTATQAAGWLTTHRKPVYTALGAVAALLVIATIVSAVQTRREQHAGAAAGKLLETISGNVSSIPLPGATGQTFPTEEAKQRAIVASAEAILAEYGGTRAAELAALSKADAHLALKEWDAAGQAYELFLSKARNDDSLRFGALEGLAIIAEGKGDLAGAAAGFERLAKEAPAYADRADLERARVLAAAGKVDVARKVLSSFPETHPESQLKAEAAARLARLGS
jgi:predicted negative regulator of RcsB-dependent stress response